MSREHLHSQDDTERYRSPDVAPVDKAVDGEQDPWHIRHRLHHVRKLLLRNQLAAKHKNHRRELAGQKTKTGGTPQEGKHAPSRQPNVQRHHGADGPLG